MSSLEQEPEVSVILVFTVGFVRFAVAKAPSNLINLITLNDLHLRGTGFSRFGHLAVLKNHYHLKSPYRFFLSFRLIKS